MPETRFLSIRGRKLRLIRYDNVASTQRVARELPVETVVIAHSQTAGRGRYGREWISPPGGMYASIVLTPDPLLPLRAGVAIVAALSAYGINARLKWPNDVTVRGKKIAGILIESNPKKMILGIGVNIRAAPIPGATSVLRETDAVPTVDELIERIIARLLTPRVDAELTRDYRRLCATINAEVLVSMGTEQIRGRAVGIDQRGRLLVRTHTGVRRIHSGDCRHIGGDTFDVGAHPR